MHSDLRCPAVDVRGDDAVGSGYMCICDSVLAISPRRNLYLLDCGGRDRVAHFGAVRILERGMKFLRDLGGAGVVRLQ
ncbi:hypothetical protein [Rhodococcus sp. T9N]|uniref:hypothetical protein n=1 Tax=Rhodococcus sp. T9N TaxID=627445 RepID=UPI0021C2FD81|nr:hypothetical protein [Rhodococcus sp. T9N]